MPPGQFPQPPDDSSPTTAALVLQARRGDREAFGRLAERFQPTVYALARRRLRHPAEAAELTQDVLIHALNRLHQLRDPERFPGWLKQMTIRLAINRATRRIPPPSIEQAVLENHATSPSDPLARLIEAERAGLLWEALAELPSIDRETLIAFYIHERSVLDVATDHHVPVGTVKRRLHVARKRLKAILHRSHHDWDQHAETLSRNQPSELPGVTPELLAV
ncbi:MAG: DNA-directed RNA polymerase sigma-70 factor [Isosphaeraceae bacterium]|jgi:RNA polymerase sigma-70 factor (ECF subfamily)|nr:MAG: DNA-directed RNA polymerase sigma-70 factor [Isosphaeraceae bacterium]